MKHACSNFASVFTRIPFAIDPLCTRLEGSSLLGLFINLRAFQTRLSIFFFLSFSRPSIPSLPSSRPPSRSPFLVFLPPLPPTRCQTTREIVCITSAVCRTLAPTLPNLLSNLATTDTSQCALAMQCDQIEPSLYSVTDLKSILYIRGYIYMHVYVCVYVVRKGYFRIIG